MHTDDKQRIPRPKIPLELKAEFSWKKESKQPD